MNPRSPFLVGFGEVLQICGGSIRISVYDFNFHYGSYTVARVIDICKIKSWVGCINMGLCGAEGNKPRKTPRSYLARGRRTNPAVGSLRYCLKALKVLAHAPVFKLPKGSRSSTR